MHDFLVFDLETQRSAEEVGGWQNIPDMKMSVAILWDSRTQQFYQYLEDQVFELIEHLGAGPVVIGYNHLGFDYTVLSGYYAQGQERANALQLFRDWPNLDLLVDLKKRIGKRIRLDQVARATLQAGKPADGLQALQWYRDYIEQGDEAKLQKIIDYCRQDVAVTRDIFLYGIEHHKIQWEDSKHGLQTQSVDWETGYFEDEDDPVQLSF